MAIDLHEAVLKMSFSITGVYLFTKGVCKE